MESGTPARDFTARMSWTSFTSTLNPASRRWATHFRQQPQLALRLTTTRGRALATGECWVAPSSSDAHAGWNGTSNISSATVLGRKRIGSILLHAETDSMFVVIVATVDAQVVHPDEQPVPVGAEDRAQLDHHPVLVQSQRGGEEDRAVLLVGETDRHPAVVVEIALVFHPQPRLELTPVGRHPVLHAEPQGRGAQVDVLRSEMQRIRIGALFAEAVQPGIGCIDACVGRKQERFIL